MSSILMTTLFYKALILQGETSCWSLLGLKGLRHGLRLICTKSYTDHNFVKIYQNLPKFGSLVAASEKSVTLIFLWREKSDIYVTWLFMVDSRKEKKLKMG